MAEADHVKGYQSWASGVENFVKGYEGKKFGSMEACTDAKKALQVGVAQSLLATLIRTRHNYDKSGGPHNH